MEAGALASIGAIGALLAEHFPLGPGQTRDNELPDEPALL
jgi:uncharacterized membrane protein